ncbi:hypothetical protein [Candidatus Nitrososphaera sp. FF02]|uniref:hypothetical protein n=1 Tax=Candidatus Nitrososphaera sp. FF02 TaxID=3398226 RepID=UPI0039ECA670
MRAQEQFELVINKSTIYRDDFLDERRRLMGVYSTFPSTDARFTSFAKCINVLNDLCIGYVTLRENVIKRDWWKEKFGLEEESSIKRQISDYEMFLRIAFTHLLFSSVESSIRNFARSVIPTESRNGTVDFYRVYPILLNRLSLAPYIELLRLLSNIRNTIHNNGVFFPSNQENQTIVYNSRTYTFEVGKVLEFVGTQFVLDFVPDIRNLLVKMIESPAISSAGPIRDLASVQQ